MLTWTATELSSGLRHRRALLGGLSSIILSALIYSAHMQVSYWRNSESLWTHTLACTERNYVAHMNLGSALKEQGQIDAVMAQYRKVLEIKPEHAEAYNNLGNALTRRGQIDAAIAHFQKALEINPDYAKCYNNLGIALASRGQVDAAIVHFRKALEINPDCAVARNNLYRALQQSGQHDRAPSPQAPP